MLLTPVVWGLRAHRFVNLYRSEFSGFYTVLVILVMCLFVFGDLLLNSGRLSPGTGALMFYPLMYVGWTVVRDVARLLWQGVKWCAEIIGSRMKF